MARSDGLLRLYPSNREMRLLPNSRSVWSTVKALTLASLPTSLILLSVTAISSQDRSAHARTLALKVGTIHPVSAPVIENGVIVIRNGRILGVGAENEVNIPTDATIEEYPDAHAYPGLVDALSSAFAGAADLGNSAVNAGADFFDALDATDENSRKLVEYGITTAYVSNRSGATWRGIGAIVRPHPGGFSLLRDKRRGGVHLRMTTGNTAGHALDRVKRFDNTGKAFDALEAYEKKLADYEKALEKYEKDYAKYLDHHKQKKGEKDPANPGGTGDGPRGRGSRGGGQGSRGGGQGSRGGGQGGGRRQGGGRGTRRRGNRPGTTRPGSGGPTARPAGRGPGANGAAAKPADSQDKGAEKPPTKPEWPKRVKKDEAKEALLEVVNGALPLRVEVHQKDEIRAALFMAMMKELPGITLEHATYAGDIAKELADSGSPVVITHLLPQSGDDAGLERGDLPAQLHAAGVSVAIASGDTNTARNLTMMAAYACSRGLPEDAAIRALTLNPAKILGIADRVGSLARNKVADVVLTSGPLLRSDSRVLRVIAQGQTQYVAADTKKPATKK